MEIPCADRPGYGNLGRPRLPSPLNFQ